MANPNNSSKVFTHIDRRYAFLLSLVTSDADLDKNFLPEKIDIAKDSLTICNYQLLRDYRLTVGGIFKWVPNTFINEMTSLCETKGIRKVTLFADTSDFIHRVKAPVLTKFYNYGEILNTEILYQMRAQEEQSYFYHSMTQIS